MPNRFRLSLLLAGALSALAQAQTYPDHPLRLVVPFATGGTSDILARFVAPPLWAALGQPVVVDNRPGAGSNVGNEIVAKAPADGYTLLMATPALASNQALYGKLNYDPIANFTPVTLVAEIPIALVVHPSMPTKSVRELIALAKAQPGKLNFGSSGNGGIGHLVGEMFKSATGINMVHVPYKGNGPALVDLMSGVLNLTFTDIAGGMPYIRRQDAAARDCEQASQHAASGRADDDRSGRAGLRGEHLVCCVCDRRNTAACDQPPQHGDREIAAVAGHA